MQDHMKCQRYCHRQSFSAMYCLLWVLGMLSGALFVSRCRLQAAAVVSCLETIPFSRVRFFLIHVLQIALYGWAFMSESPWFISAFSFGKAFTYGICSCSIFSFYGASGFLVHFLLLFSDSLMIVYFLYQFSHQREGTGRGVPYFLFISGIFSIIQTAFISPFYFKLVNLL